MKCTLYDTGIGVALILSVPGLRQRLVSDALVSQLDLFPTLCELLGFEPPERLRGRSLLPLLRGEAAEIHDAVFAEINFHAARDPQRAVRTRRYKYIRRYGEVGHYIPCNIDAGESKELLCSAGLLDWDLPREELFDLLLDPAERRNLLTDPAYGPVLDRMRSRLQAHLRETGDSIPEEGLPDVPGVLLNRTDCYDAELTQAPFLE